jgi:hypothetical protein
MNNIELISKSVPSRNYCNLMTSLQNINIVYTLVGGFTARQEIFTVQGEKSLAVPGTCPGHVPG